MKIEIVKYKLLFKFEAGTSRGVMLDKNSWFIKLFDPDRNSIYGIGECGPLPGLSPDLDQDIDEFLSDLSSQISLIEKLTYEDIIQFIPARFPALRFALETALLDLNNGGRRLIIDNNFVKSKSSIPINGLVWMGNRELMIERIKDKIEQGFDCIKIKVGAINFDDELALLKYIRKSFSSDEVTIRLDANGAFNPDQALSILDQLSGYDIHSIEQPIKQGNWVAMNNLCKESPIPIALDEELIGVFDATTRAEMLDVIKPAYIILKPTLLGGLLASSKWIDLAESKDIGWWITSALESNIGLNAIAQFTADYPVKMPQGLGTGQLFHNNFPSPLQIERGALHYDNDAHWDLSVLA